MFQACQTVFNKTRNQCIKPAKELDLEQEVAMLSSFFSVNETELYVLVYYIYKSLNDDTVYLDKLIAHFGDDLAQLPAVNQAIYSLIRKKRLQERPKSHSGRMDAFVSALIHPRTIEGLLKGSKQALKTKPVKNFIELLDAIDQQVQLRSSGTISGDALHAEVESLLITNKHFKELKWMNQFNLPTTEKIVLLMLVDDAFQNNDISNLPDMIGNAALTKQAALMFQNCLLTGDSNLLKHDLIELESNQFRQCDYGFISSKTYEQFFHEGNIMKKKMFHSRVCNLIENEKVEHEPLFYN